jgi:hypothetical protein
MVSDANTLYWIESNTGTVMVGSADTKGFTILCIGCAGDLLLQDEHHLYSLRGESIMEISKALTKANTSLAKGSCRELYKGPVWRSMAVDSEFVYFTAQYGIMRVRKMNQATESLVTNLGKPVLVLLDEANVYFIDAGPPAILGSIRKP